MNNVPKLERWKFCLDCGQPFYSDYMVRNSVWDAAGLLPQQGVMHLKCLDERLRRKLGRGLALSDFPDEIKSNEALIFGASLK